jgi:DNA-binding MarR family transcriptional regulator
MLAGRHMGTASIMFHQAVADRLGLNVTDHKCIDLLLLNGPLTAGELAQKTGLTTGAVTAVIDRLERAGFARRQDDPNDRRRVIVAVVSQRLGEIERLFRSFAANFSELAARYKDKELAVILDFMTRCREGLHQSTLELRGQPSTAAKQEPPRLEARKRAAATPTERPREEPTLKPKSARARKA